MQLRSASEQWDTCPANIYSRAAHRSNSMASNDRMLNKQQSLTYGQSRKKDSQYHHPPSSQLGSSDLYLASGNCSRELSPVRWCDQEVDGVYLNRSGWVQVQQRSLDENRRTSYDMSSGTLPQPRRSIKLVDYHSNSEPGNWEQNREIQRPMYLPIQRRDCGTGSNSPSSPHSIPESYSPPSITPIISPPPAFQDVKSKSKSRYYYGTKFLPRSKAIDTDILSPPQSPVNWGTTPARVIKPRQRLTPSPVSSTGHHYRIPQTKSLEDTTPSNRRSQFIQKYLESSSSSSSSLGFRSLDSCVSRPVMPRLNEINDSSIEGYEDGDEDEISSSIHNTVIINSSPETLRKLSPSSRTRNRNRRSPSDQQICLSNSSSSSCSPQRPSPQATVKQFRRGVAPPPRVVNRPTPVVQESQRVRRSRSLQLPEKRSPNSVHYPTKVSPQQEGHRKVMTEQPRSRKHPGESEIDEEMLREAEVVTEFLYGNRSRAAAKALLLQRYHDQRRDDKQKEQPPPRLPPSDNGFNIYFVSGSNTNPKRLQRGQTTPNMNSQNTTPVDCHLCNTTSCDYWPQCTHRDQYPGNMRVSQSYPSHQRSPVENPCRSTDPNSRSTPAALERMQEEQKRNKSRATNNQRRVTASGKYSERSNEVIVINSDRAGNIRRNNPTRPKIEVKTSPKSVNSRSPSSVIGGAISTSSSSSSDIWVTTSDRTTTKSPRNAKSSGASTPLEELNTMEPSTKSEHLREMILTRPGSAPADTKDERLRVNTSGNFLTAVDTQQRSMSLPKSFLSTSQSKDR